MAGFMSAAALLPPELRRAALGLPEEDRTVCEELRLRRGCRASALLDGREYVLEGARAVTDSDLYSVLEAATRASLHAAADQLRRGFIAAPGGVRVGVCGTAVMGAGGMEGIRNVSSLCIRVPRAVPGCADGIWPSLTAGGFRSTLIASPPGGGKTTLLRELIRRLSASGLRVAAADERGEIADAWSGVPGFDLGPCADVLTGMPKAQGAGLLLRAMGPQIIAMDEVADGNDAGALLEAAGCGVRLLATVHGGRGEAARPLTRRLLDSGAFERLVWIENYGARRRYTVEELPCA